MAYPMQFFVCGSTVGGIVHDIKRTTIIMQCSPRQFFIGSITLFCRARDSHSQEADSRESRHAEALIAMRQQHENALQVIYQQ